MLNLEHFKVEDVVEEFRDASVTIYIIFVARTAEILSIPASIYFGFSDLKKFVDEACEASGKTHLDFDAYRLAHPSRNLAVFCVNFGSRCFQLNIVKRTP